MMMNWIRWLLAACFFHHQVTAQPCKVQLQNDTIITVQAGTFLNPDFCGKACTCTVSYDDLETGIPTYSVDCPCREEDINGRLQCGVDQETVFIDGKGLCTCEMPSKIFQCRPWAQTPPPSVPPTQSPSMMPVGSTGQVAPVSPTGGDEPPSSGGSSRAYFWGVQLLAVLSMLIKNMLI